MRIRGNNPPQDQVAAIGKPVAQPDRHAFPIRPRAVDDTRVHPLPIRTDNTDRPEADTHRLVEPQLDIAHCLSGRQHLLRPR
jgi:hypothetical protein